MSFFSSSGESLVIGRVEELPLGRGIIVIGPQIERLLPEVSLRWRLGREEIELAERLGAETGGDQLAERRRQGDAEDDTQALSPIPRREPRFFVLHTAIAEVSSPIFHRRFRGPGRFCPFTASGSF